MNDDASVATWDVLQDLGFQPDESIVRSDVKPGLSFDFGNFKLSASCVLNLSVVEVVLFTGILFTPRSLTELIFELPRRLQSREQCAAWIVWDLDQHSDGRLFKPTRHINWVEEGRQNQMLLPWVAKAAASASRPCCAVQRDWLRLALKTLRERLVLLADDAVILFAFDGSVLSIRCDGKVIVLPGEGLPWTVLFTAQARDLRRLPTRLMREHLYLAIWESRLSIDGWTCTGTIEPSASQLTPKAAQNPSTNAPANS
jgi:hypothetical protein